MTAFGKCTEKAAVSSAAQIKIRRVGQSKNSLLSTSRRRMGVSKEGEWCVFVCSLTFFFPRDLIPCRSRAMLSCYSSPRFARRISKSSTPISQRSHYKKILASAEWYIHISGAVFERLVRGNGAGVIGNFKLSRVGSGSSSSKIFHLSSISERSTERNAEIFLA